MAQKYHTQIVSEERSKDGRGIIIRERPVKCSGKSDCEFCSSERRSRRPSRLEFTSYGSREGSSSRSSSLKDRLPTPYNFDYKPVRRSSRDDDAERYRERRPGERDHYYSDGERVGDYGLRRGSTSRGATQPIPIPKPKPHRASTMYEDDIYDRYYPPSRRDSWRRTSPSRHESARVYPGFYDVLSAPAGAGGAKEPAAPRPSRHHHRRRRHSVDVHQDELPVISYGATPVTGSYTSTPYGSYRSSLDPHSRTTSSSMSQSPPKSVRWGDDPRALQNARIDSRPRLGRSASLSAGTGAAVAGAGSHFAGEVKSILKKPGETPQQAADPAVVPSLSLSSPSPPPPPPSSSAPAVQGLTDNQYAELYRSAQGMGVEDRATGTQRRAMRERAAAAAPATTAAAAAGGYESRDMIDNLRRRLGGGDRRYSLDVPSRRFTGSYGEKASSGGRRTESFYDDRYSAGRW